MTCADVRPLLVDLQRGRVSLELEREIRRHLESCPGCARATAEEEILTGLLEERLPIYPASPALKRRLASLAPAPANPERAASAAAQHSWTRPVTLALASAALAVAVATSVARRAADGSGALASLTIEAVNDHVRVLERDRPVDVESSGSHEVKPWFEGKLDFAPSVPAAAGPEMRLEGGSLAYFIDRKAAAVVYRVRRHVVTLLVFRADGLPWPAAKSGVDERTPSRTDARGFHVFMWRSSGLGYALVGDVEQAELSRIAAKLAGET